MGKGTKAMQFILGILICLVFVVGALKLIADSNKNESSQQSSYSTRSSSDADFF